MADIIRYTSENIAEIGRRLLSGEVGIIPCDTIYGLCGKADDERAERLYEIKRRPKSKSFITLMTKAQVLSSSLIVPDDILSRWPAPLTAIVKNGEGGTSAIRVPSDDFIRSVIEISGPIYSTSVNFSGEMSLLTFQDILPVFNTSVDFIVEAEIKGKGMASTIVDATEVPYKVLRQGSYTI